MSNIYSGTALMDSDGEIIDHFTQWDRNKDVYIDAGDISVEPVFHFANKNSKTALGVQSELVNGKFKARVPNILLQEALPINIWVYVSNDDFSETIYTYYVSVIERLKPPDYIYEETEIITISNLFKRFNMILAKIGNIDDLQTEAATLVGAINEILAVHPMYAEIATDDEAKDYLGLS